MSGEVPHGPLRKGGKRVYGTVYRYSYCFVVVRQPNVSGNAGSFTNGMPMTASLGCGTWGGNIISENVTTKHYMNTTWVSRTIPVNKPAEQEIFGRFFNSQTF